MNPSTILVTPLSHLDATLKASGATRLLSLLSPGTRFDRPSSVREYLLLRMNDIVAEEAGLQAPRMEQVAELIGFVRQWDRRRPLVMHCQFAVSRSTAAAFVAAATLMPDRDEAELARELRRLAPWATPNCRIVSFADDLLLRGGRMAAAIAAIGRGTEAAQGMPFAIPVS